MRVQVPANVDMADRIVAGLTARQLVILACDALVLWVLFLAFGRSLSPFALGAVAVPLAAAGLAAATSTPHGLSVDRLLRLAIAHLRSPKRRVLAPEGWRPRSLLPSSGITAIRAPVVGVSQEGFVNLGAEGVALICRASGLNLGLRAEEEQEALVEGFGRLLNSLEGPVQFLVRSRRVDLASLIAQIQEKARGLPHPALERAAREHAVFLSVLSGRSDILRREVLVCFREPGGAPEQAAARLARRFDEAQTLLRAIGITLRKLAPEHLESYLRGCTDPEGPPPPLRSSLSSDVITGATR